MHWIGNSSGSFSSKEAWQHVRSRSNSVPWTKTVWSKLLHPRTACFIWHLLHRNTPMQSWAHLVGINLASRCPLCKSQIEPDYHIFFACNHSTPLWNWTLSVYGKLQHSVPSAAGLWTALSLGLDEIGKKYMVSIFFEILCTIWFARKEATFSSNLISPIRLECLFPHRLMEFYHAVPSAIMVPFLQPFLMNAT